MTGMESISSLLDGSAVTDLGQRGIIEFVLIVAVSMVLGFGYALIYQRYFTGSEAINESLHRSFVLLLPAVTTIFWVIQFSIPLSLGLLGALSFVRFRTPIKRAEDIAFILLVIATGLACAIYQFAVAVGLLLAVGVYTLLKSRFVLRWLQPAQHASLVVSAKAPAGVDERLLADIVATIREASGTDPEIVSAGSYEGEFNVYLTIATPRNGSQAQMLRSLDQIEGVEKVDIYYS